MAVRGKQVHVAAPPKCAALNLTPNAMPGDRRDHTATPKAMCLLHWLVSKGNFSSQNGGILLQSIILHMNVCWDGNHVEPHTGECKNVWGKKAAKFSSSSCCSCNSTNRKTQARMAFIPHVKKTFDLSRAITALHPPRTPIFPCSCVQVCPCSIAQLPGQLLHLPSPTHNSDGCF